jgi:hypothetical protein
MARDPYHKSKHWHRLRAARLKLDNYTCIVPGCGKRATTVVSANTIANAWRRAAEFKRRHRWRWATPRSASAQHRSRRPYRAAPRQSRQKSSIKHNRQPACPSHHNAIKPLSRPNQTAARSKSRRLRLDRRKPSDSPWRADNLQSVWMPGPWRRGLKSS